MDIKGKVQQKILISSKKLTVDTEKSLKIVA